MRDEDFSYYEDKAFKRILQQYEEAKKAEEPVYLEADDLTDIAEYYMMHGQEEDADKAALLAMQLHPDSVDPQIFMARQHMFHDRMEEAHRICDNIIDQNDQEVLFLNAELMIREQRDEDAYEYLMKRYEQIEEERAYFLYDSADIFFDYALWDKAQTIAKRLQKEYPKFPKTNSLLADILVCQNKYEEAIPLLNQLIDDDPYNVTYWNMLAESQGATEQFAEAIDTAEYALTIERDNPRALLIKANCYFHLNMLQMAHDHYQQYLKAHQDDDTAMYLDAVCLSEMERYQEAHEMLLNANEVSGEMAQEQLHIYYQQAFLEGKLHLLTQALITLKKARNMDDGKKGEQDYYTLLGQIYLENGKNEEAVQAFQNAIDVSEDRFYTLMQVGIAYEEQAMYQKATQILLTVMEQCEHPESVSETIPYLAICYYQLQDTENFLSFLKAAPGANRQTTKELFGTIYPNVEPEEYYLYAYHDVYGRYPEE